MKKTIKHKATKIAAGHYLYRGYTIKRFDYATLGDPEGNVEWNVYAPGSDSMSDSEPTLGLSKWIVDTRIKQWALNEKLTAEAHATPIANDDMGREFHGIASL
jgi:hypothetical protein